MYITDSAMNKAHVLPRVQIEAGSDECKAADRQLAIYANTKRPDLLKDDAFFAALGELAAEVKGRTQSEAAAKPVGALHADVLLLTESRHFKE